MSTCNSRERPWVKLQLCSVSGQQNSPMPQHSLASPEDLFRHVLPETRSTLLICKQDNTTLITERNKKLEEAKNLLLSPMYHFWTKDVKKKDKWVVCVITWWHHLLSKICTKLLSKRLIIAGIDGWFFQLCLKITKSVLLNIHYPGTRANLNTEFIFLYCRYLYEGHGYFSTSIVLCNRL